MQLIRFSRVFHRVQFGPPVSKPIGASPGCRKAFWSGLGFALTLASSQAQFVIGQSAGLNSPVFRDLTNQDLGNTTFFGWGPSSGWNVAASGNFGFDGATDDERIDNPAALQGAGGLAGVLNQIGANDILASSNNIYSASNLETHLSLQIPVNGTIGSGFTTIYIQGRSANFGPSPVSYVPDLIFASVAGVAPQYVDGSNLSNQAQFWVKYEIPGNLGSYEVDFALPEASNTSIAELQVDTKWSRTGFVSEAPSPVPEPSSLLLVAGCGLGMLSLMRRRCRLAA